MMYICYLKYIFFTFPITDNVMLYYMQTWIEKFYIDSCMAIKYNSGIQSTHLISLFKQKVELPYSKEIIPSVFPLFIVYD